MHKRVAIYVRVSTDKQTHLRAGKGILKTARECGVGTGTVQRIAEENGPFDESAAAWNDAAERFEDARRSLPLMARLLQNALPAPARRLGGAGLLWAVIARSGGMLSGCQLETPATTTGAKLAD